MNNQLQSTCPESQTFLRVVAAICMCFGCGLIYISWWLWDGFQLSKLAVLTVVYGVGILALGVHAWTTRLSCDLHARRISYGVVGAGMLGAVLAGLLTNPNVADLPLYHPKTLSSVMMAVTAIWFIRKALTRT